MIRSSARGRAKGRNGPIQRRKSKYSMEGEIGANDSDAEVTDEQERRGDRLQVEQCFHGLLHSIGVRAFAQGEVKGSELLTIPQGKS